MTVQVMCSSEALQTRAELLGTRGKDQVCLSSSKSEAGSGGTQMAGIVAGLSL